MPQYTFRQYHALAGSALLGLAACQAPAPPQQVPAQFAYSPTITVFETTPTQLNSLPATPPAVLPAGMVYVPGGYTQIGSATGLDQEKPQFWILVQPFLLDQHEVTVGQFRAFVQATGYRTQAEGFGNAGVLNERTKQWELLAGANWQYPYGPQAGPAAASQPVAQVSWHDAQAYAKWAGKRLPDELEWEHAARNGRNSRVLYPFGDSLRLGGKYLANTWNGHFPDYDRATDGFHRAAPVGSFGTSPLGLADMAGNVWEWCANYKQPYADVLHRVAPAATAQAERAQRGGSFLCEAGWCYGYRVSGRSGSTPETALMHVGFRCAKDL
ncbi:MAG: formylglycine-generating enzyme family protein [Janthinobacterium lividum]